MRRVVYKYKCTMKVINIKVCILEQKEKCILLCYISFFCLSLLLFHYVQYSLRAYVWCETFQILKAPEVLFLTNKAECLITFMLRI